MSNNTLTSPFAMYLTDVAPMPKPKHDAHVKAYLMHQLNVTSAPNDYMYDNYINYSA